MRLGSVKRALAATMVVGALGSVLSVGGVFGLMNGEVWNRGGTAATGTLTFSNQVGTGTICATNTGTANVNSGCDALVTSSTLRYPGDSATIHVTIANTGSIDGGDLSLYMPTCTPVQSPGATAAGVSFAGNPCDFGGLQLYIQETDSSFSTNTTCWYPTAGSTCAFTDDTFGAFAQNAIDSASALDLGAGPAHGQSRYFVIGIAVPTNASFTLQGREADFDLTWHLQQ